MFSYGYQPVLYASKTFSPDLLRIGSCVKNRQCKQQLNPKANITTAKTVPELEANKQFEEKNIRKSLILSDFQINVYCWLPWIIDVEFNKDLFGNLTIATKEMTNKPRLVVKPKY